jgi:hypothetical protein
LMAKMRSFDSISSYAVVASLIASEAFLSGLG